MAYISLMNCSDLWGPYIELNSFFFVAYIPVVCNIFLARVYGLGNSPGCRRIAQDTFSTGCPITDDWGDCMCKTVYVL